MFETKFYQAQLRRSDFADMAESDLLEILMEILKISQASAKVIIRMVKAAINDS